MKTNTKTPSMFRSAGIAGIVVGAAALLLSTAGCARQTARLSATDERVAEGHTTFVGDGQQPAETPAAEEEGRMVMTKHGPRRSR